MAGRRAQVVRTRGDLEAVTAPPLAGQDLEGESGSRNRSWWTRDTVATDRPWHDGLFWALQAGVVVIFVARLGITELWFKSTVPSGADFTTIGLFVWPVLFAAVTFGAMGSAFTTAVIAAMSVSRLFEFARSSNEAGLWSESTQIVVLCVIALVVGRRVAAERVARLQADEARRAHLAAEARYRDLFETNGAPILIIDKAGKVVEANPAAESVFGALATGPTAKRLGELVDRQVAWQLLEQPAHRAGEVTERDELEGRAVVRVTVDGAPMFFRTEATWLTDEGGNEQVQLVLNDVTAETLRQEWTEAYAARVMNAQEEERRHIAQELHDGPLQALVYLCRRIDEVERNAGPEASGELEELRHLAESLIGELRGISRGLRPSVLDDLGLVAATRRLLEDLEKRTGIDTTLGITGPERRLPIAVELALFRVAQEAISNAELHAEPKRVAVGMSFEPGGVRVLVSDDGHGFDTIGNGSGPRSSLGLVGMRERLHMVGGRVEVHSSPAGGTTVDAWASV
jgi:PAS domain S-box-containing protein